MRTFLIVLLVITGMSACSKMSPPTTASISSYAQATATPNMKAWSQGERFCNFPARAFHAAYNLNEHFYVVAGRNISGSASDIWWTIDCENWVTASAKVDFLPREEFGNTVFNNKMWVIAGINNNKYLSDVWCSSDGVVWTTATATAGFGERAGLSALVFNGDLIVSAGTNGKKAFNDIWSSKDGSSWTKLKEDNDKGFSQRTGHKLLAFAGKLWVIGGKKDEQT